MIRNIWNALFGENGELARIREVLISVIVATAVSFLIILMFRPSIGVCIWLTLIPWVFSAYRLFSIERLIRVHIAGEILETAEALINPKSAKIETGVFENEFSWTYLKIISGIFFVQTTLFLMSYLYVNYTTGGITPVILIAMMSTMLVTISRKFSVKVFVAAAVVTMFLCSVGLFFYLFPQVGFYTGKITENIHVVPASTAQRINKIESVRAKQIEDADNEYLEKVLAWQEANPGKEPPQWYKDALAKMR